MLLSRNDFRKKAFERDNNECKLCGAVGQDAHHIIERRFFPDGGYYIDNAATVCGPCHIKCETTEISVETIREKYGIKNIIIPPHFYHDVIYDKWGNIIQSNGTRLRGELFYDESVQKALISGDKLRLFVNYVKYPRTYHVSWSENIPKDDRKLDSMNHFKNCEVVVTEKMDGQNVTLYNDYIHTRSVDSLSHPSTNWVKNFWAKIKHDIPDGYRICGENLYAKHSITYNNLKSFFYGFSIWNDKNECLDWESTVEYFDLLGIVYPKVMYHGIYDEKIIKELYSRDMYDTFEGYVIRKTCLFTYTNFKNSVAKFVRHNHVQTVQHWMYGQKMIINNIENL